MKINSSVLSMFNQRLWIALALAALPLAHGQLTTAYDNGLATSSSGREMSGWVEADDFTLSSAATLTEIRFYDFETAGDYNGSFTWQIYSDGGGKPGTLVSSGTTSNVYRESAGSGTYNSYLNYIGIGRVSLAPGTYWVGLHNGSLAQTAAKNFYWYQSSTTTGTAQAAFDSAPFGDGWGNYTDLPRFSFVLESGAAVTHQSAPLLTTNFIVAPTAGLADWHQTHGSSIQASGYSSIGQNGTGTLTQTGGFHTTPELRIAENAGSTGTYELGGTLATVNVSGALTVGLRGTGTFSQTAGAVSVGSSGTTQIGAESGATGTWDQSAGTLSTPELTLGNNLGATGSFKEHGGTLTVNGPIYVGFRGTGSFEQTSGTVNGTGLALRLGEFAGSSGSYTLSGGTLNVNRTLIGAAGTGTFTQTAGTHAVAANITIGNSVGASGNYTLSGGAVSAASIFIGLNGGGTFTQTGGTVSATTVRIADNPVGRLNLNGGTMTVADLQTGTGTATLNFTKGTLTVTRSSVDFGALGLVVGNFATLNLGNGTHTIANGVHVRQGGTLNLAGAQAGGLLVSLEGGALTGNGTVGNIIAYNDTSIDLAGTTTSTLSTDNFSLADGVTCTLGGAGILNVTTLTAIGIYEGLPSALYQTGGTHTTPVLSVATAFDATGIYGLDGGLLNVGNLIVGDSGRGTFTQAAGTVSFTTLLIGNNGSYNSRLTISGGSATGNTLTIGRAAAGTLNIDGGSLNAGNVIVGDSANGSLNQTGGTLSFTNMFLGNQGLGDGTFTINGGSATGGTLSVGEVGTGTLNIDGGTLTLAVFKTGPGTKTIVFNKGTVNATSTAIALGIVVGDGTNAANLNLGNGPQNIVGGLQVKTASTLTLNSSNCGGNPIALQGGTLIGAGIVGSLTATNGSIIAPGGAATGLLSTTDNLALASGATYRVDLASTTPGTGYDQLNVTGTVTLGSAATLTLALGFNPVQGNQFTLIANDGTDPISGTFQGFAQDATFSLTNSNPGGGTFPFRISYTGGTGNDVVITVVPEPGTGASLLGGAAVLVGLRRFRRVA